MTTEYAPPVPESEGASPSGASGPRSGFWRRFAASLIDGVLVGAPFGVLAAVVPDAAVAIQLISFVVGVAYYVLLEGGARGQTVGKMALGIRVWDLRDGGGPIGYGRAAIRYFGRIVSSIALGLGYFWMLWDREKQTWHDKFAGSVVVPVDAYPVD